MVKGLYLIEIEWISFSALNSGSLRRWNWGRVRTPSSPLSTRSHRWNSFSILPLTRHGLDDRRPNRPRRRLSHLAAVPHIYMEKVILPLTLIHLLPIRFDNLSNVLSIFWIRYSNSKSVFSFVNIKCDSLMTILENILLAEERDDYCNR